MVSFNLTIDLFGVKTEAKCRDITPLRSDDKQFISFCTRTGSTERVKLNISFVIFNCISRHFRGVKIKIFRGSMRPNPPTWLTLTRSPLATPVENVLRGPCIYSRKMYKDPPLNSYRRGKSLISRRWES